MKPEQFVYWLQEFIELNGQPPTADQWESIKEHLSTVFLKVTALMPVFKPPEYRVQPLEEPRYNPHLYNPKDGCRPVPYHYLAPQPIFTPSTPGKSNDVIC